MLIVRDVFTAKPGNASKLAAMFRKVFGSDPDARVMTDLVGNFNTVILERQAKDLAAYEELLNLYRAGKPSPNMDPNAFEEMTGYADLFVSGKREIFQLVD